jgi:hypothetical protein
VNVAVPPHWRQLIMINTLASTDSMKAGLIRRSSL